MKSLMETLTAWTEQGALRSLDLALARFIEEQQPQASKELLLATALLSEANGHGHVCLNLQTVLAHPDQQLGPNEEEQTSEESTEIPVGKQLQALIQSWTLDTWVTQLLASETVTDERGQAEPRRGSSPLVLAGTAQEPLLYLRRYWQYERQIQAGIQQRLQAPAALPPHALRPLLDALFSKPPEEAPDWQKIACALAARSPFAIITGGPGTGKTTTVVRLLALLQGLQREQNLAPLQIRLAAPTGKAAARLNESLASDEFTVTTLHRLLGSQPSTRHFRHHAGNPLPADLVVVDEASMVDVEMLAKLLDALTPQTRLILLGDKDQLASVEAGSVLGDLCRSSEAGHYTPAIRDWLQEATGQALPLDKLDEQGSALAQATSLLRHSYRFANYPGIGELAKAVNGGHAQVQDLQTIFEKFERKEGEITPEANLKLIKIDLPDWKKPGVQKEAQKKDHLAALKKLLREGYRGYLDTLIDQRPQGNASREKLDAWALNVFASHRNFQLLTAVRRGPWGVETLNQLVLSALKEVDKLKKHLPAGTPLWYSGRPVLVTRNDYSLKLMNGDIGICLEWPASEEHPGRKILRVAFPDGQGGIRWVLPSRLQSVETVFAMTVHKSQGSEFTHTALVLPERHNPVLTKELLYTGITRSSQAFTLVYSQPEVLQQTLSTQVERASGLAT